jgi:hypothetical protein
MSRLQHLPLPILIITVCLQRRPQHPNPPSRSQLETHISPHRPTPSSHCHIVLVDAIPDAKGEPGDYELLCSCDNGRGGLGFGVVLGGEGDGVDGDGELMVEVDQAGELDEVASEVVAKGGVGEVWGVWR